MITLPRVILNNIKNNVKDNRGAAEEAVIAQRMLPDYFIRGIHPLTQISLHQQELVKI